MLAGLVMLAFSSAVSNAAGIDFATTIQPIFNKHCIACHEGSFQYDLRTGASYGNIVNVVSTKYGTYKIKPNFANLDDSAIYTVIVVQGKGSAHNGNDWVATQADKDNITNWINQGALPDLTAPTLTAVSPAAGAMAGGTAVTLTGTRFGGTAPFPAVVKFGGVAATDVVVKSFIQITCKTPAGAVGTTNVTVSTTAGGAAPALSNAFTYVSAAPVKVAFGATPATTLAGSTISPVTVQIQDALGSVTTSTADVTLALGSNPGGSSFSGTLTAHAVAGIATFSDLSLNRAGNGYTFTAASTGLTGSTSAAFNITASNPVIVSATSASITTTDAALGGVITSDGGGTITAQGVVAAALGINGTPRLGGTGVIHFASPTTGLGGFTVNATPLAPGTSYAFAAYATNSSGTAYTATGSFKTVSNNANLVALATSQGTTTQPFSSGIISYLVRVPNTVTSIAVTPTVADATASVMIGGESVASGTASSPISLNVGNNFILVSVTAQDNSVKTYTLRILRASTAPATLAGLSLTSGSLSPDFDSATVSYTSSVPNSVTSIRLTPVLTDASETVTVNGIDVANNSASDTVDLNVGSNSISVVSTSSDATSQVVYTVNVTRAASSNATLASLVPNRGSLSPAFDAAVTEYGVTVLHSATSISFTATVAESHATLQVNGNALASGTLSMAIALAYGDNAVQVQITAQDSVTKKTYTVTVHRPLPPVSTLAGLSITNGSLFPNFATATTEYSTRVPEAANAVTVTPVLTDASATMTVNSIPTLSGNPSAPHYLLMGSNNLIRIVVTASDASSSTTYNIAVTRGKSSIASLFSLTSDTGSLTPGFNTNGTFYAVDVPLFTTSLRLTSTVLESHATLKVKGVAVGSGSASAPIPLAEGDNLVPVVVTAEDGTTTKTYTVNGRRGFGKAPRIVAQPAPQLVAVGGIATFNVSAVGYGVLSYQWKKNGAVIPAATASSYSVTPMKPSDAASYSVVVTNTLGAITSDAAALTVAAAGIDGLPHIDAQPLSALVPLGQPASFTASASGAATLAYQWRKGVAPIPGAVATSYPIAVTSIASAGTYSLQVKNAKGAVGSAGARLGVVSLVTRSVLAKAGTTVTLSVSAAGDSLFYQWRKDGAEISDGTSGTHIVSGSATASLVIKGANTSDTGSYTCVVRMGRLTLEGGANALKVYDKAPLILLSAGDALPPGIVSGTYTPYTIPVDQSPDRSVVSFAVTPLPAGLKFDTATGTFSGKPTKASAPGKPFDLTLTATNGVNKTSVAVKLTIAPLPAAAVGTFNGLVARDPSPASSLSANAAKTISHGGSFTITTSAMGTYTGKITLGALSYSFINQILEANPANPEGRVSITRALPLHSLSLTFAIDKDSGELKGTLTDNVAASPPLNVQAWRGTAQSAALATTYTSVIDITSGQTPDPLNNRAYPQGHGFGTLTVTAAGAATWTGRLADGTLLNATTTVGSTGQVPLHFMLYSVPGSLHGWVKIKADDTLQINAGLPLLDGSLDWVKDAQATTSTNHNYKGGFALHALTVAGGKYSKPTGAVLGLTDNGVGTTNASFTFTSGGIDTASMVSALNATTFRISSANGVTMPTGAVNNPATLALTLNAAAGTITGTCLLKNDADPTYHGTKPVPLQRNVSYSGLLVTRLGWNQGYGYFLLSELPSEGAVKTTLLTSDVLSGQLMMSAKPSLGL